MIHDRLKKIFTLGFRLACYSSLGFWPVSFFILLIWFSLLQSVLLSTAFSVIVFGLVFLISLWIVKDRLTMLSSYFDNIAQKEFTLQQRPAFNKRDEIDAILQQSVATSQMVEREITRLNQIENYRKEFIGDISHELKTPLFAVQGFIETLLNGALEDEKVNREFLEKAMRNVDRLNYLTRDLMEISRLETGEMKSDMQVISLNTIIAEVVESLQYKARKETVKLHFEEHKQNVYVLADRNQIRQVLINLIENAIKYNKPKGKVIVSIEPIIQKKSRIMVSVTDTGLGIEKQDIDRVTERFYRVDKSRSRDKGGTGLGLSIVKHILEAHNSKLTIESIPQEGSTFSFTLIKTDRIKE